jgi:hypothetical protein
MKLTYSICQDLIKKGRNGSKKLDHNTYLLQDDSETPKFYVQLHGNTILVIYPEKVQHFDCGWQTVTTKDRLNKFGHLKIFQKKGVWYTSEKVEFQSGAAVYYA